MTQVDFYILEQSDAEAPQHFACRLAEKAWRQGHKVHIHAASAAQAQQLDALLWSFRDLSFVPHSVSDDPLAAASPIHIGYNEQAVQHHDVLINLDQTVPLFFSSFERVAELVGQDEQQRQLGRIRFTFYRDRGYPLQSHTISAGSTT